MKSKLGIGLALYNDENIIGSVIESIQNQTFQDFVIYVFDNNSSDNSLRIVEEYQKTDNRIVIVHNSINIGFAANVQRCLEITGCEYVSLKSSNDILSPQYYEKCIQVLEEHNDTVLVYSKGTNEQKNFPMIAYDDDDLMKRLLRTIDYNSYGNLLYGVYRRSVIDKILPMQPIQGNDHVFLFNLALNGKIKMLDEILYNRKIPDRTQEGYMKICHSNRSQIADTEPDIKVLEMFLGYMDVINESYINFSDDNICREDLRELVAAAIFRKFQKKLFSEYKLLKKFVKKHKNETFIFIKYKIILEKTDYYLKKYNLKKKYIKKSVSKFFRRVEVFLEGGK